MSSSPGGEAMSSSGTDTERKERKEKRRTLYRGEKAFVSTFEIIIAELTGPLVLLLKLASFDANSFGAPNAGKFFEQKQSKVAT